MRDLTAIEYATLRFYNMAIRNKKLPWLLSLLLLIGITTIAQLKLALELTAKVVKVFDGDTIDVMIRDSLYRVRLFGIDAPESGQDFFAESKQHLEEISLKKEVSLQLKGKDRYGRELATIIRVSDNLNINYEMVKSGLAWHFTRYTPDPELAKLEAAARQKEVGIWSLYHYLEPWEYRKNTQQKRAGFKPALFV